MIEGVRDSAIAAGLIENERFDEGVRDLYRTAEPDGVFSYTFLKGVATKRRESSPAASRCDTSRTTKT